MTTDLTKAAGGETSLGEDLLDEVGSDNSCTVEGGVRLYTNVMR